MKGWRWTIGNSVDPEIGPNCPQNFCSVKNAIFIFNLNVAFSFSDENDATDDAVVNLRVASFSHQLNQSSKVLPDNNSVQISH